MMYLGYGLKFVLAKLGKIFERGVATPNEDNKNFCIFATLESIFLISHFYG